MNFSAEQARNLDGRCDCSEIDRTLNLIECEIKVSALIGNNSVKHTIFCKEVIKNLSAIINPLLALGYKVLVELGTSEVEVESAENSEKEKCSHDGFYPITLTISWRE